MNIPPFILAPVKAHFKNISINTIASLLTSAATVKVWGLTQDSIAFFHQKNQKIMCSFTAAIGITVSLHLIYLSYQILLHTYQNANYAKLWDLYLMPSFGEEMVQKMKELRAFLNKKNPSEE